MQEKDLILLRERKKQLATSFRAEIIPQDPPLVAGEAERLARMNATMAFNVALKQLAETK